MIGEYLNITLMCAMINILFLGGWHLPWGPVDNSFLGFIVFYVKLWVMFFMFAMVKAIVPRYRYDQLMRIGWKIFLPTSLVAVALAAGYVAYFGRPAIAAVAGG
jgi:NADH-quinone oxidoreductase subunit H